MKSNPPERLVETLSTVAWAMHHFGSVVTGGSLHIREVRKAAGRGLVKSVGRVPLCDGNGFTIHPERYREGFVLTDDGIGVLRRMSPEVAEMYLGKTDDAQTER